MHVSRLSALSQPPIAAAAAMLVVVSGIGCERSQRSVPVDSAQPPVIALTERATSPARPSGWERTAGPVLLVQGATREEAIVLFPEEHDGRRPSMLESSGEASLTAVLLGRGGGRDTAQLVVRKNPEDAMCRLWPIQGFRSDAGVAWSVGFVEGQVAPVALDSVETLSARDSATLVAEASRLASDVTARSAASFQGLRFTAHDIRRFTAASGVQALVAHLIRKVNQEANPQEEQTLIIAERDSGVTRGPYQLAYVERTHGLEEEVAAPEVIAAVRLSAPQRVALVVARDGNDGVSYSIIERSASRAWRVRWTSRSTHCA